MNCNTLQVSFKKCNYHWSPNVLFSTETILFPSGYKLESVSPDTDKTPKDAYMFDASETGNKKLSLSFKVNQFKHSSQDLFRADPMLLQCLQKLQNNVQAANERVSF